MITVASVRDRPQRGQGRLRMAAPSLHPLGRKGWTPWGTPCSAQVVDGFAYGAHATEKRDCSRDWPTMKPSCWKPGRFGLAKVASRSSSSSIPATRNRRGCHYCPLEHTRLTSIAKRIAGTCFRSTIAIACGEESAATGIRDLTLGDAACLPTLSLRVHEQQNEQTVDRVNQHSPTGREPETHHCKERGLSGFVQFAHCDKQCDNQCGGQSNEGPKTGTQ